MGGASGGDPTRQKEDKGGGNGRSEVRRPIPGTKTAACEAKSTRDKINSGSHTAKMRTQQRTIQNEAHGGENALKKTISMTFGSTEKYALKILIKFSKSVANPEIEGERPQQNKHKETRHSNPDKTVENRQ